MEEALVEELVEEILLRLPPGDPVSIFRAATVCRRWCRIISAPGFRRRFGRRHRTAPTLGYLANVHGSVPARLFDSDARFVPATPFRPRRSEHSYRQAIDARHGRVLLYRKPWGPELEVWDPVTDELWKLPELPTPSPLIGNAAVVCANYGACDHLDCHCGQFLVVVLDERDVKVRVHRYSSEDGAWSKPSYGPACTENGICRVPTAFVGTALFFLNDASFSILKYDLDRRNVSVIHMPRDYAGDCAALTAMGDGGLGFASVKLSTSTLWVCSMETYPDGDDFWVPIRSIQLETLLQVDASSILDDCIAFAHGGDVVFVGTCDGWFSIDLKSGQVKEQDYGDRLPYGVVQYMSFYTPDLHRYAIAPV